MRILALGAAGLVAAACSQQAKSKSSASPSPTVDPAVALAKGDGLGALGQFIYYDAAVVHGRGKGSFTLDAIRATAMARAATPAQGGNEVAYLNAFLDARIVAMKSEPAHQDVSRIETAQRVFLRQGNLGLRPPLSWKVYGDSYTIAATGLYSIMRPMSSTILTLSAASAARAQRAARARFPLPCAARERQKLMV